jgi:hypothetical protein
MPDDMTTVSSSTSTQLPDWVLPYAQHYLGAYSGLVFNPDGSVRSMPDSLNQQVAPFTQDQRTAMGSMEGTTPWAQGLAGTGSAGLAATLGGAYLDPATNPYLRATYQAAADPVTQNYQFATAPSTMAAAQRAGQMGGTAYDESRMLDQYGLGRQLNDLATNIYGGNYQQERSRQSAAQQFLPGTIGAMYQPAETLLGVGAYQQNQTQREYDTQFQNALRAQEFPFALLSGFGSSLGQAAGGSGSSTSTSTFPNSFLPGAQGMSPSGMPTNSPNNYLPYALAGVSALPGLMNLGTQLTSYFGGGGGQ